MTRVMQRGSGAIGRWHVAQRKNGGGSSNDKPREQVEIRGILGQVVVFKRVWSVRPARSRAFVLSQCARSNQLANQNLAGRSNSVGCFSTKNQCVCLTG